MCKVNEVNHDPEVNSYILIRHHPSSHYELMKNKLLCVTGQLDFLSAVLQYFCVQNIALRSTIE